MPGVKLPAPKRKSILPPPPKKRGPALMPDTRPLKAKTRTTTVRRVLVERVVEKLPKPKRPQPRETSDPILLSRAVSLRASSLVDE